MRGRLRYYLSNGFHGTTTYLSATPGQLITGARMRQAGRKLCPYSDCLCATSAASDATDGQRWGYDVEGYELVRVHNLPAQHRPAGWDRNDMDAAVIVPVNVARLAC